MIRLQRKPSLWMNFLGRFLFGVIWAGVFAFGTLWVWRHRYGSPVYVFVILGIFDLISIGVLWDLIARFQRTINRREPLVEIDHEPAYGDSVKIRVTEQHPESLTELGVKLVGECYTRSEREFTQHREAVVVLTRCYQDELTRAKPSSEPVTLTMLIPKSPPADEIAWKVIVDTTLKQGGIIEHEFPIRVRTSS
jgi:hypothetical protein